MDTGISQRAARLKQVWQTQVRARFDKRQSRWLARRVPPAASVRLSHKIIFILPTFQGTVFALGALVVLVIALAERNLVAMLLAGLMLSLFLLSLVLCYRKLSGLRLSAHEPVSRAPRQRCFAGDTARFTVDLQAAGKRRTHSDLWLGFGSDALQVISLPPGGQVSVVLDCPASARGLLSAPRLMLHTVYPAGLWRAWSRPDLAMQCLVYPRPLVCALPVPNHPYTTTAAGRQRAAQQGGVDDFVGLRAYQTGDPMRRIAWRSLARGQGLKTKQFVQEAEPPLILNWETFAGRDPERVLSCLCYQVLQLSRRRACIGLKLPDTNIKPGQGEQHKHELLQVLALWP